MFQSTSVYDGDLASSWEKLARALLHIRLFTAEINNFLRTTPFRIIESIDSQDGTRTLVPQNSQLPDAFVCAVGDIVHNLRSSLDHLACAIAKRYGVHDRDLRRISFSIASSPANFKRSIAHPTVVGIGISWSSFLRKCEPYPGGKGSNLYVISVLDNIDKHRNLIVVNMLLEFFSYNDSTNLYKQIDKGIVFARDSDAVLDRIDFTQHTHHRTTTVFGETIAGLDSRVSIDVVLNQLARSVQDVLAAAQSDLSLWPV